MAIKTLLNIIVLAGIFGVLVGGGLAAANAARARSPRLGYIIAAIGLVIAIIVGPLNAGLVLIQSNEVGVVFRQTERGDNALLEPLGQGLWWVVPFIDQVIIYDVGQKSLTMAGGSESFSQTGNSIGGQEAVRSITEDGQTIFIDVTVVYRLDPALINQIHREWRGNEAGYEEGLIVPKTRSEVRNVVSGYGAEEIYSGGRTAMEGQIFDKLTADFAEHGFLITDLLIRDISFSPEFTQAIETKQIAQQQAEQAAFRVQQAQQEAEQARVEAQGKADAAVIAAQGEAQSITIHAQAESEALKLINTVLAQNPNLIQWQYVNNLSDQVQLIVVPSNTPFLFDLQQLLRQSGQ